MLLLKLKCEKIPHISSFVEIWVSPHFGAQLLVLTNRLTKRWSVFFIFLQDVEIRTNAALYLPQISDLLNRVPRQMLLLVKTNDLLRGIETTLQTRASSSSFINMSRCCIRAVARWVPWFCCIKSEENLKLWHTKLSNKETCGNAWYLVFLVAKKAQIVSPVRIVCANSKW